jgi:hypothetical protein
MPNPSKISNNALFIYTSIIYLKQKLFGKDFVATKKLEGVTWRTGDSENGKMGEKLKEQKEWG